MNPALVEAKFNLQAGIDERPLYGFVTITHRDAMVLMDNLKNLEFQVSQARGTLNFTHPKIPTQDEKAWAQVLMNDHENDWTRA